jgi:hypothetical protein
MAHGIVKVSSGRHIQRAGLAGLRRPSLAALVMLVAQYGLGIVLNLYVAVPASDEHAGIMQEIASGPLTLTLHALLGLALVATAIVLLVRAVGTGDRPIAVLAAAGLTAIGGAFASGEIFVRSGEQGASLAMALLTGVALLCYIGALARAGSARRRVVRSLPPSPAQPDDPPSPWPGEAWPGPDRPGATRPASPDDPFPGLVVPARNGGLWPPPSQAHTSWFTPE